MVIDWKVVAQIIEAVAWPLVVTMVLLVAREPLIKLIREIGRRTTKLSIGDYSIELAAASEMKPAWSAENVDFRQLNPSEVFDSASQSLFAQLSQTTSADYAIIDLDSGSKWLSSRLYIFALILGAVSGLKAFVFVERRSAVAKTFVGIADPEAVCTRLATLYPWFQAAFIQAYANIPFDPRTSQEPFELKQLATANSWQLANVVQQYVYGLQQQAPPHPDNEAEWESFDIPAPTWERTHWLTGEIVEKQLGDVLSAASYIDSADISKERKIEKILRRKGKFVALLDDRGRFSALVDRSTMLDELGPQLAKAE